jgi:hypothetical protein
MRDSIMSHIIVKKAIGDQINFAGHNWWYHFRILPKLFEESSVKTYVQQLSKAYSKLAKSWNDDLNSEWICRIYLGLKMVLSTSVMLESLEYAERKNLRVVIPYLEYYCALSGLRAIVFTSTIAAWDDGEIIKLTHKKTINVAGDVLAKLDQKLAGKVKQQVLHIKAYRELISYRAPSSGDSFSKINIGLSTVDLCQMLVEVAQLQSEVLEASVIKHTKGNFSFKEDYMRQICMTEIDGISFWDDEDAHRLGYLERKYPFPTNILHMMAEGHVEDFFGSWCAKEETDKDVFNPDENWRIIFDV